MTHHPFFTQELFINSDEKIIIRVASDGLWNVLHKGDRKRLLSNPVYSSESLSEIAVQRWNKLWNYDPNVEENSCDLNSKYPIQKYTPIGDPDDIAVVTFLLNV